MALFITGSVFAQDFSGRATYKTHRKSSFELDSTTMAANPGIQEQMEAQMRKMFQKTFTTRFHQIRIYVQRRTRIRCSQRAIS